MSPSCPTAYIFLNRITINPATIFDKKFELKVLRCSKHRGSSLQYLHPPSNPLTRKLSSNDPERLSLTKQQLKLVKPRVPRYGSHSTHLIIEVGSYSGVNSSTLAEPTSFCSANIQLILSSLSLHRADTIPNCY